MTFLSKETTVGQDTKDSVERILIPAISLRDVVVFPSMVIPLFVGREKSIIALRK